ncbi:MAG TPA: nucleotide exchange factor GrpE [Candidatus Paceibacterota bacterium]
MNEEKDNENTVEENNSTPVGGSEPSEPEKCRAERDEYLAGWQRAKADLINYKKEEFKRLADAARYQLEDAIYDLLSVLDNFDLAISAMEAIKMKQAPTPVGDGVGAPTASVGVEKGIYLIRTQLEDALKRRGLARIAASPGDDFNPGIMEAVAVAESDGPPDKVVEVIEMGYKIHEKILRPARVRVSKKRVNE